MEMLWSAVAALVAYLIGSLSFAVIVSRTMGLSDPRSYGSKNPGATNVLRSGNKKAALLTLLFDALKGYVPVVVTLLWGGRLGLGENAAALVGFAAFLGHLWPVFFGFKGGKGVATAAGVLLGLNPALGGLVLLTWVVVAYLSRYSSLAAIIAALSAPLYDLMLWGGSTGTVFIGVMGLLLVWRHFGNIQKLIAGTEGRIGEKASAKVSHPTPQHAKKGAK